MAPTSVLLTRIPEKMNRTVPFLLLAGLLAPSATAQQSLADQLPGDTAIYFEVPDVNQFGEGFASSSLGRIWSDEAMQAFLEPVLPMIEGAFLQAQMGMEAQGIPGALLDPSTYGRLEVGMAFGEIGPMGPDMLVGAELAFHDGAVAEAVYGLLGAMLSEQGAEVTEKGIHFSDGVGTVDVSLNGTTLTLLANKGYEVTGKLTEGAAFQAARGSLASGQMFMHMDFAQLFEVLNSVIAAEAPPEAQMAIPMLIQAFGLDSLQTLSVTTGWRNGESFGDGIMSFGPQGPTGLIGIGVKGGPAADKSLAKYVPANATAFSIGNADFEAIWSFLTGTVDQMIAMAESQGEQIDRNMPELAWLYGEDRPMYDKAFAAIGPEAFSWSKAEFSMTGGGGAGGSYIRVRDVDAVRSMMSQVMPQLSAMLQEVELVDLLVKNATDRKKDAEGNWTTVKLGEYYQVRFNLAALPIPPEVQMQLQMAASAIPQPAFGVTDDGWMVFSMNGSSGVRKAMKNGIQKPDASILSNEEAADFLGRVPEQAGSLRWSDPRPFVGGMVTTVQGFLPMIAAQAGDEMPLDLDKMPGPDSFTKHLRTSEAYAWYDGKHLRMKSVGSLDGGDMMALAAMGGAAFAGVAVSQEMAPAEQLEVYEEWEVVEEPVGNSEEATLVELLRLDTGLMLYSAVNGSYPASLDVLLAPQQDWEDGFLSEKERGIEADAWGNAFVYKLDGDSYKLYSCGPNGTDDGGAGDDLSLE